ncbi:MAG: cupredoxin domain-containing protein, partial [Nitrospinae bacterium]|nr:cupredoxin domain-containing protein [Nitrospinota bacterium]
LNITATGQHTFTIDELGVDVILPHGETTRVEFTPEQTGSFQFYCSVPGHKGAGQVGTITVE